MIRDYSSQIEACWPTITRAYCEHSAKQPIIEFDLAEGRVGAYPADAYINSLSVKEREKTRENHARAVRNGDLMLFVRDSHNRVLQSYVFSAIKKPQKTKLDNASHHTLAPRRSNVR